MNKKKGEINEENLLEFTELFSIIWLNKKLIFKMTLLFFLIGIIHSLSLKNIYRSSSIFYPHYEKVDNKNDLKSLAGLAGINLQTSELSNNIPSSLYPMLINSPIFKRKVLDEIINYKGVDLSYREYILDNYSFYSVKKFLLIPINYISNLTKNKEDKLVNNYIDMLNFSDEENEIHQFLTKKLLLNLNKKDGFLELSVDDKNPYVASQIAEISKNILQESIIDFKIKNINATYQFINEQLEIAKTNFYILQDSLAKFKDKNKNIKSDLFLNQLSRIESEYNLSKDIYNELALNKERIAIDVRKNTPIFTVIKPVVIPNDKSQPKRSIIVLIYTTLGMIIISAWVLIKKPLLEFFSEIRKK